MPKSASMTTPLIIKFTELVINEMCRTDCYQQADIKALLTINPLYMITFIAEYAGTIVKLLCGLLLKT